MKDLSSDGGSGDCEPWAQALDELADGAEPSIERALLDAHVERCADCATYSEELARPAVRQPGLVTVAAPARDVAAGVRRQAAQADRESRPRALRWMLALLGIQIIAISSIGLLSTGETVSSHDASHAGAFALAFGVGVLIVARRPAKARTLLTVGQVLAVGLLISAVVDVMQGTISLAGEMLHLPEALAVVVLWMLADVGSPWSDRIGGLKLQRPGAI